MVSANAVEHHAPEQGTAAPNAGPSTGMSTALAEASVDAALADAARLGEITASRARALLPMIAVPPWLYVAWGRWLLADIIIFVVCGTMFLHGVGTIRYLKHRPATRRLLVSTVIFESLAMGVIPLAWVITREETWHGAGKLPGTYTVILVLVSSGFRLSRRAVVCSVMANAVWMCALLYFDMNTKNARIPFELSDWLILVVLSSAAAMTAYFFASRARLLALQVASQTVKATRGAALLGAYMSKEVAQEALAQDELRMGGDRKMAAVLFSDLRGYTAFSEGLEPEELVAQLNRYLAVVVKTVSDHGGVVDKYIGDGMMAVFGIPSSRGDDAGRAIRAAFALQDALVEHNESRAKRQLSPLRHGIGVHYGEVIAGNIGTKDRASYTVIGDTVNLASRLESMTKEQGIDTLVTADAVSAAKASGTNDLPQTVAVGELKVRGREAPVPVVTFARELDAKNLAEVDDVKSDTIEVSDPRWMPPTPN